MSTTEETLREKFKAVIESLEKGDFYDSSRWGVRIEKGDQQLRIELQVGIFRNKYIAICKRDFELNGLHMPVTKAFFNEIRQILEQKILTIK